MYCKEFFTVTGQLLFADEGERKRKVDKQEEKPAKHKSVEYKGEVIVNMWQQMHCRT